MAVRSRWFVGSSRSSKSGAASSSAARVSAPLLPAGEGADTAASSNSVAQSEAAEDAQRRPAPACRRPGGETARPAWACSRIQRSKAASSAWALGAAMAVSSSCMRALICARSVRDASSPASTVPFSARSASCVKYPTRTPRGTTTSPRSACSCPMTMRKSVDFPAPLGPINPTHSPSRTCNDTSVRSPPPRTPC